MIQVHHRTAEIDGHSVFYREAGSATDPVILLLHGFPSSSHMFRNLIPTLADRYHVIAPDHLGFGYSDAPSADDFEYTFDALAAVTAGLLTYMNVDQYALYVQDYGAPIGWRLAMNSPDAITAIVTQNGNAYKEGFLGAGDEFLKYAYDPNPDTEAAVRAALTLDSTKWLYLTGPDDPTLVSPDAWTHDQAFLDRPGNDLIQLALFRNYKTNVEMYPRVHEYFRASQVPLMAVWGERDEIFGPDGARAFLQDLPEAELHLLPAGHFALESHLDSIAGYVRGFLGRIELSS